MNLDSIKTKNRESDEKDTLGGGDIKGILNIFFNF
jgi:hypothetical protein